MRREAARRDVLAARAGCRRSPWSISASLSAAHASAGTTGYLGDPETREELVRRRADDSTIDRVEMTYVIIQTGGR